MRSKLFAVFAIAFNQWSIYLAIVMSGLASGFGPPFYPIHIVAIICWFASPILGYFAFWKASANPDLVDWVRLGNKTLYFPKSDGEIAALKDWIIKDFTHVAENLASACVKQEAHQKQLTELRNGFQEFKKSYKVSTQVDLKQYRKQTKDFELAFIGFQRILQADGSEVAMQWRSVKLYIDLLIRFKIKPEDYDPAGLLEELKSQERMEKARA